MNTIVLDLSHHDGPGTDYAKLKANGIVGVIYKATQGSAMNDSTYRAQRQAALAAGLLWGSFHFGDNSDPAFQADNYVGFARPAAGELFCLDFEDNAKESMGLEQARAFIVAVEAALNREGHCVFYSGNRIKELLNGRADAFFAQRRLWLAQYGDHAVVPPGWRSYWLWQYTDGEVGPPPHSVPGAAPGGVDCNHFDGSAERLTYEWATGGLIPPSPPTPAPAPPSIATVKIYAPPGVEIQVFSSETKGS